VALLEGIHGRHLGVETLVDDLLVIALL